MVEFRGKCACDAAPEWNSVLTKNVTVSQIEIHQISGLQMREFI